MTRDPGSRSRRSLAAVLGLAFTVAFAAMLVAQLALMSLLDPSRAEGAAREVANSEFTGALIDQTVREAVDPLLEPEISAAVAATASQDPQVRDIVRISLIAAHRQMVDPGTGEGSVVDGNAQVEAAIVKVLGDAGQRNGVDLSGVADEVGTPTVVPRELPDLGLQAIAERIRSVAGAIAVTMALLCVAVHPRRGRAVAGLGWKAGVVCTAWALGLLAVGWLIGLVAETLFGELLGNIWSASVPAMLSALAGGVLLSVGAWLGGLAVEGLIAARSHPPTVPPQFEHRAMHP